MNTKYLILLLWANLYMTVVAAAQVQAPALHCATKRFNGDVDLVWDHPNVTCGTVNGYFIYARQNDLNGPFSLLAAVPTNTTVYAHVGANGNNTMWYYYMATDAGCGGQVPLSSDTLDNQPPTAPELQTATTATGQVVLTWDVGSDKETHAYVIYNTDTNVALDTVFGRQNTTFADANADPTTLHSYTIVAMDSCFNAGVVNVRPHHNIVLQGAVNRCAQTAVLHWNLYDNWRNGVAQQEIWVGINGNPPTPIDTLPNTATDYTLPNLHDGDVLCFSVHTIAAASNFVSISNTVCLGINIVQPTKYVYMKNVTINPDNSVGLDWEWNTDIDMDSYGINSSDNNVNYQRFSVLTPIFPLSSFNRTTATFQPIEARKVFYKIESIDSCQKQTFSNYGSTIFLTITPESDRYTNVLTWTAYDNIYGTPILYDIYRVKDANSTRIATVGGTVTRLDNRVDPNKDEEQDVCYYVVAYANVQLPNGINTNVHSRSNTVCGHQAVHFFMPNAFAPDGVNSAFKPLGVFTNTVNFYMAIYDRWGAKIFETTDIDKGWDGTNNGKPMQQGVYAYLVRVRDGDTRSSEQRGNVMLVR
jgi:gliding motility-associated-like protein